MQRLSAIEAWSAILKYEKTPIKAASSGLGKVISRLPSRSRIHLRNTPPGGGGWSLMCTTSVQLNIMNLFSGP